MAVFCWVFRNCISLAQFTTRGWMHCTLRSSCLDLRMSKTWTTLWNLRHPQLADQGCHPCHRWGPSPMARYPAPCPAPLRWSLSQDTHVISQLGRLFLQLDLTNSTQLDASLRSWHPHWLGKDGRMQLNAPHWFGQAFAVNQTCSPVTCTGTSAVRPRSGHRRWCRATSLGCLRRLWHTRCVEAQMWCKPVEK